MIQLTELHEIFIAQDQQITTDSRKVESGDVFFALRGDNFNGNRFAESALRQGAAYCVIDDPQYAISPACLLVDNVLETLQQLAAYHRWQLQKPVVAITGSNGKTTTKELINSVLSQKFATIATTGNLNNHIGVPLTLLRIRPETEIAIVEMGANHQGEIRQLCSIARPNAGLITNIGKAHLEGFGSFEGVQKAKGELYDFLRSNNGTVLLNSDNSLLTKRLDNYKKYITYGRSVTAHFCGKLTEKQPFVAIQWREQNSYWHHIATQLIGSYNFENILAAVCVGRYFGVEPEKIAAAIQNYIPKNNRSEKKVTDKNTLILDAYNANPSSMTEALHNFASSNADDKAIILGDMFEMGEYAAEEHEKVIRQAVEFDFRQLFFVGNEFSKLLEDKNLKNIIAFRNVDELIVFLQQQPLQNATVLLKGSRGVRLEKAIPYL